MKEIIKKKTFYIPLITLVIELILMGVFIGTKIRIGSIVAVALVMINLIYFIVFALWMLKTVHSSKNKKSAVKKDKEE